MLFVACGPLQLGTAIFTLGSSEILDVVLTDVLGTAHIDAGPVLGADIFANREVCIRDSPDLVPNLFVLSDRGKRLCVPIAIGDTPGKPVHCLAHMFERLLRVLAPG